MTTGGPIKRGAGGERLAILLLTLCALLLRLYALDAKGLAYDEAGLSSRNLVEIGVLPPTLNRVASE